MESEPNPNPEDVHDERSFLEFVRVLAKDSRLAAQSGHGPFDAPRGWQNSTVEDFLEAAVAWAENSDFGRTQGLSETDSPWRRFAVFLYTGKIYE